jgi:hypothetical protein
MSAVAFSIEVLPSLVCLKLPIFDRETLSVFSFDDCDELVKAIRELLASKRRRRFPELYLECDDETESVQLERFAPNGGPIHFITVEYNRVRQFGGGMCHLVTERTFLQLDDARALADQLEAAVTKARQQIAKDDEGVDFIEDGSAAA